MTKATKATLTMFSQPLLKKLVIDFCCVYTVASFGESWGLWVRCNNQNWSHWLVRFRGVKRWALLPLYIDKLVVSCLRCEVTVLLWFDPLKKILSSNFFLTCCDECCMCPSGKQPKTNSNIHARFVLGISKVQYMGCPRSAWVKPIRTHTHNTNTCRFPQPST